jgi:cyclic pyranopterin phosphate synthase
MHDELTHFDERGRARMVDVGGKAETRRSAVASARVTMQAATLETIMAGTASKGDVLGVAQVAAIMGAKKTSELVPMCHPLSLTAVNVDLTPNRAANAVDITVRVETRDRTGVEMEALTAASVAALTIYDMVKAIDRGMLIEHIRLEEKHGGKAPWVRQPGASTA